MTDNRFSRPLFLCSARFSLSFCLILLAKRPFLKETPRIFQQTVICSRSDFCLYSDWGKGILKTFSSALFRFILWMCRKRQNRNLRFSKKFPLFSFALADFYVRQNRNLFFSKGFSSDFYLLFLTPSGIDRTLILYVAFSLSIPRFFILRLYCAERLLKFFRGKLFPISRTLSCFFTTAKREWRPVFLRAKEKFFNKSSLSLNFSFSIGVYNP